MTWILESPLLICVLGAMGATGLAIAWASSGKREVAIMAGLWVGLTLALLLVERLVVTDNEQIQILVQQIATDVRSNNPQSLKKYIHSSATALFNQANSELPNYQFTMLRITRIHTIDVTGKNVPRSATVDFNVVAAGTFTVAGQPAMTFTRDEPIARYIKLFLKQEADGKWRVEDYTHANPTAFMFSAPPADAMGSGK